LVTFIGVPAVIIVILSALIIKNLVTGKPQVVDQSPDPNLEIREAEALYAEAAKENSRAKQLSDKGNYQEAERLWDSALRKAKKAYEKGRYVIQRLKEQLKTEELPDEYAGYYEFLTRVAQLQKDIASMKGFGIKKP